MVLQDSLVLLLVYLAVGLRPYWEFKLTVSNSYDFGMTIDEIIRKASIRAETYPLTGEGLQDALKSLNLVMSTVMNDAVPLAMLSQYDLILNQGVQDYTLDPSINDVHHVVIRDNTTNSDLGISRRSVAEFNSISDKTQTGRPTVYTTERRYDCVVMRVWPIPDDDNRTLYTYSYKLPDDAERYTENLKIQARYLPTIIAGLALELAMDKPGTTTEKLMALSSDYDRKLKGAQKEDRERVTYKITPGISTRF